MDGTSDILRHQDTQLFAASEALSHDALTGMPHVSAAQQQHVMPDPGGHAPHSDVKLDPLGHDQAHAAQMVAEAAQQLVAEQHGQHPAQQQAMMDAGGPKFVYIRYGDRVIPFLSVGGSVKPSDIGGTYDLIPETVLFAGVRLPTRTDGYYDVNVNQLFGVTSETEPIEVSGKPLPAASNKRQQLDQQGAARGERAPKQQHLDGQTDVSGGQQQQQAGYGGGDGNGYTSVSGGGGGGSGSGGGGSTRTGAQLQLPQCLPAWVREDRLPDRDQLQGIYPKVNSNAMQGKGRGGSGGRKSCKICTRALAEYAEWPEAATWVGMSQHCCVCLLLAVRKDPLEVLAGRQNLTHRELCKGHKCACLVCSTLNGGGAAAGTPQSAPQQQQEQEQAVTVPQPVVMQPQQLQLPQLQQQLQQGIVVSVPQALPGHSVVSHSLVQQQHVMLEAQQTQQQQHVVLEVQQAQQQQQHVVLEAQQAQQHPQHVALQPQQQLMPEVPQTIAPPVLTDSDIIAAGAAAAAVPQDLEPLQ